MREKVALTLTYISEGYNLNEIQQKLNIDRKEMNKILKIIRNAGYNYTKDVSSDGTLKILPQRELVFKDKNAISINVKDRVLKAIFISDLHIGSAKERPELLKRVFEYARLHNIHIIINGGDVIDNVYEHSQYPIKDKTVEAQLNKFLSVYPYDPNIVSLNLYGNHDRKSIIDAGLDVGRYIEERRFDVISLGYGDCRINLNEDAIAVVHNLNNRSRNKYPKDVSLIAKGHSHKCKNRDNKIIYIPALSENTNGSYEYRPLVGFLSTEFTFYSKKISRVNISQLAFVNNEIRLANEETIIMSNNNPEGHNNKSKKLTKTPNIV